MKIKTIIITLGLITSMISGGIVNYINSSKGGENTNTNTAMVEENVVNEENIIDKVAQADVIQTDIPDNENGEIEETKQEEKVTPQEESSKIPSTQTTQTNTNKGKTSTQETTTKQESNKNVVETQKREEPQPQPQQPKKELTESDLEYWCVSGGTHHIAGNGENEHGYYSSWDEANQAFENYTKDWDSVQFKINHCSCGLYYFWAIH